ncbi:unnamed protein product, partial [Nesidiocoris tenuis]
MAQNRRIPILADAEAHTVGGQFVQPVHDGKTEQIFEQYGDRFAHFARADQHHLDRIGCFAVEDGRHRADDPIIGRFHFHIIQGEQLGAEPAGDVCGQQAADIRNVGSAVAVADVDGRTAGVASGRRLETEGTHIVSAEKPAL